jgi:EAL domain-containing protein (putative c-di-GMP-specific phosphodiesterase class I)
MQSLLEGIETQEQAEAAKSAGIDLHQGYFYGRPQPMSGFD